jgi:hypothetical protein
VYVDGQLYHDVNIHTQVRALADAPTLVGIGCSYTLAASGFGAWGYLALDGSDRWLNLAYAVNNTFVNLGRVNNTPLSYVTNEMNLRLVVSSLDVSFTAWPEGSPEPAPQLSGKLPSVFNDVQGHVTVFVGNRTTSVPVAFRSVNVGSVVSPIRGDFNGDFAVDNLDIDPFALALTDIRAYRMQYPSFSFLARADINGDGLLNNLDIDPFAALLTDAAPAAVPEPSTLRLLAIGLFGIGLWKAFRRAS